MLLKFIDFIGKAAINLCDSVGSFTIFVYQIIKTFFTKKIKYSKVLFQMEQIGANSLFMCILTGICVGAVLVIQTYKGFKKFGGNQFLGPVLALSMSRELGPVLTGFMVTARSSSSIATEIGTMRISEQLDALSTLRINIFQYLIVPRVLAGVLVLPLLTLFCMISGMFGGYIVSIYILGLTPQEFQSGIKEMIDIFDIQAGLIKASVFGFVLTCIGSFKGYFSSGGARGVGISTTNSVVISSCLIIIVNYFLAILLFGT